MKRQFQKALNTALVFTTCTLSGFSNVSIAQQLNVSDIPLFLGKSVDPNVFFDVDDSGSMDWEILTVPHWESCAYHNKFIENEPTPSPDICDGGNNNRRTNGLWRGYELETGDDPTDPDDTGFGTFEYIYANSDSAYSHNCTSSRETIEQCASSPSPVDVDWRILASKFNVLYYNSETNYGPWAGTGLGDGSFTAAKSDPQPGTAGHSLTRDLTGFVYEEWVDDKGFSDLDANPSDDVPRRGANLNVANSSNDIIDLWDSHVRFTVNATSITIHKITYAPTTTGINPTIGLVKTVSGLNTADIALGTNSDGTTRTVADVQQNIANWYEYHRRRSFVAKAAIAEVITTTPDFRYGLTVINEHATLFNEVPAAAVTNYSAHNTQLLNDLFDFNWPARGTPLRQGLERAGQYFDDTLGKTDPIISECQLNFSVLFTDGFWNGNAPASAIGNADGDGHSITVADVAKYYYDKDLSPLANVVPTSTSDPNQDQHMVTFTVAFGVEGVLRDTDTPKDGFPNPTLTENGNWGDPFNSTPAKIDDLWHAAFNSKGTFVSARTPEDVSDSLNDALNVIISRTSSASAVATNSTSLNAQSRIFQARFNSADWSGEFEAILISDGTNCGLPAGQICTTGGWEVNQAFFNQPGFNFDIGREIISYNPTAQAGIAFRWPVDYTSPNASTDLDNNQVVDLLANAPFSATTTTPSEQTANQQFGSDLIDFLRGDASNEGVGQNFRIRSKRLSDIVNSDPIFVGAPAFRYPDALEPVKYSDFKKNKKDRTPVVYVGANDGMLHAFNALTGQELLAYVPSKVYENLPDLADTNYAHKFFVNGAPTVGDAYFQGANKWRTVLVGGLAQGGKSIYALDVTHPGGTVVGATGPTYDESNAAKIALWEFTDNDDADLGLTFSQPAIVKMANGQWAAVFGNGYNNSGSGEAVLYVLNIEDGSVIAKLSTGVGSPTTPNGLSTPAPVDVDGDDIIDLIYAGDIQGNLWKFDMRDNSASNWVVAYGSNPIFTALSPLGVAQPITSRPNVGLHPKKLGGYMVYFGTGKYVENGDNTQLNQQTQTFYGVWDKDLNSPTTVSRGNMLKQEITFEPDTDFDTDNDGTVDTNQELRTTTNNQINWATQNGWYLDLINTGATTPNNHGERQITNSLLRNGRIIFTTLTPSSNPCDFGGDGWLMELDAADGSKLGVNPFDFNNDGQFDSKDNAKYSGPNINEIVSGKKSKVGIISQPTVLYGTGSSGSGGCFGPNCGDEFKYSSGSSGAIDITRENAGANNYGRQTWREISR